MYLFLSASSFLISHVLDARHVSSLHVYIVLSGWFNSNCLPSPVLMLEGTITQTRYRATTRQLSLSTSRRAIGVVRPPPHRSLSLHVSIHIHHSALLRETQKCSHNPEWTFSRGMKTICQSNWCWGLSPPRPVVIHVCTEFHEVKPDGKNPLYFYFLFPHNTLVLRRLGNDWYDSCRQKGQNKCIHVSIRHCETEIHFSIINDHDCSKITAVINHKLLPRAGLRGKLAITL